MANRTINIIAKEARAIEVGEETGGAGAPGGKGGRARDTWATHRVHLLMRGQCGGHGQYLVVPLPWAQLGGAAFLIPSSSSWPCSASLA